MMILVTDGFFEWENTEGEQLGIERLIEVAREHRDAPARTLIDRLTEATRRFGAGVAQADDLTALVIKKTG